MTRFGLCAEAGPPPRLTRPTSLACGSGGAEIGCLLLEGRESHRSFVRNFRVAAFTLRLVVRGLVPGGPTYCSSSSTSSISLAFLSSSPAGAMKPACRGVRGVKGQAIFCISTSVWLVMLTYREHSRTAKVT